MFALVDQQSTVTHEQAAVGLSSGFKPGNSTRTSRKSTSSVTSFTSCRPDYLTLTMDLHHSDILEHNSEVEQRNMSLDQIAPLRIRKNLEAGPRNGHHLEPVHLQDQDHQKVLLDQSEARYESVPQDDAVVYGDRGAEGMIPVQGERTRASGQRDFGTQTDFGDQKKFWPNRWVDLALIPCMWVSYCL